MSPRERLLQRIGDINDFSRPRPLVTLEEFFDGNNDFGSIGYNLRSPPGPQPFYELLRQLRDRPDVREVRIEVKDLESPRGWPSTDTIWFVTSATAAEVAAWFPKALQPDAVVDGFAASTTKVEPCPVPDGCRAVGTWYD